MDYGVCETIAEPAKLIGKHTIGVCYTGRGVFSTDSARISGLSHHTKYAATQPAVLPKGRQ